MVFECEIRNVSKCDSDKKDRHLHILIIYNYNYYVHALCCFLRLSHFSVQYHTVSYHIMFQKSTQTALSIYIYVADTYTIWTVDAHGVTEKKTSKCLPRLREEAIFSASSQQVWTTVGWANRQKFLTFQSFRCYFWKLFVDLQKMAVLCKEALWKLLYEYIRCFCITVIFRFGSFTFIFASWCEGIDFLGYRSKYEDLTYRIEIFTTRNFDPILRNAWSIYIVCFCHVQIASVCRKTGFFLRNEFIERFAKMVDVIMYRCTYRYNMFEPCSENPFWQKIAKFFVET